MAVLAHSPFRSVDWRWARACRLVELDAAPSRHDDEVTTRAVRYLRPPYRAGKGRRSGGLLRRFPDVRAAHRLHELGDHLRLLVQARLLAGQVPHEIATLTALTPAAVHTYGLLFFDVAAHLTARDWIITRAIGPWADRPSAPSRAALLKAFAYFGGPRALEAVLPILLDRDGQAAEPPDLSTAEGRLAQAIGLVVAAALLPDGPTVHRTLARLHLDLLKRRACGPPRPMLSAILAHHAEANLEALVSEAAQRQARKPSSAAGRAARPRRAA